LAVQIKLLLLAAQVLGVTAVMSLALLALGTELTGAQVAARHEMAFQSMSLPVPQEKVMKLRAAQLPPLQSALLTLRALAGIADQRITLAPTLALAVMEAAAVVRQATIMLEAHPFIINPALGVALGVEVR
jgi:hypothetical protein